MLAAAVPVASAALFGKRVHEQRTLHWRAGNNQPLDAFEVAAGLLLVVRGAPWRQRFEEAVAAAPRMTGDAAGVAFARAREDRLDPRLEEFVIDRRGRRAHPCGERLPLGVVLREPVLASTVPVAAACLFGKRVHEQWALQRRRGNDEPLNALEITPRLFLVVRIASRRQ